MKGQEGEEKPPNKKNDLRILQVYNVKVILYLGKRERESKQWLMSSPTGPVEM